MEKSHSFKRHRLKTFLELLLSSRVVANPASSSNRLCPPFKLYVFLYYDEFCFNFSNLYTKIIQQKKNIGLRAHSRAKDQRTSLAGALIENQYRVLTTEESPKLRFEKIGNWWQLSLLDMRVWSYFEAVLDFELKIQ